MKYFLLIINIISFFIYYIDKRLAVHKLTRISEFSLFIISFFGGGIGSIGGMIVWHHKTKKWYFWLLNIFNIVIWIGIIYYLM